MTTLEALQAADANFKKVNAEHKIVTAAFRARTVNVDEFFASLHRYKSAIAAYDAAEAAYVAELDAAEPVAEPVDNSQGDLF